MISLSVDSLVEFVSDRYLYSIVDTLTRDIYKFVERG